MKRRYAIVSAIIFLATLFAFARDSGGHGTVVQTMVHSQSLEHNHLNESPDREISIYLPPGYEAGTRRYPVLYLLHGYTGTNRGWMNPSYVDLPATMDRLLARGEIEPMIVVMPNSFNRLGGSWYSDSALSGNGEDFIVRDLVEYMDAHYRTLAKAASRGVAGHSMGGYGALKLGMRHPEVFSAAYGSSPCCTRWTDVFLPDPKTMQELRTAKTLAEIVKDGSYAEITLSMSAAFSPDPANPPFGVDWPFDASNHPAPTVVARWKANLLDDIAEHYAASGQGLHAIGFDVGRQDENPDILMGSRQLDRQMTQLGIAHTYWEYEGTHDSRIAERMEKFVLPFMSKALAGEGAASAAKSGVR